MNKYIFSGNLTADCDVRYTPSGTAVCNFTVAVNDGYGEKKRTEFIKCGMFGKRAEGKLKEYLVLGQKVIVEGRPKLNKREHQGKFYADIEVFVENVELVGRREQQDMGSQEPETAATSEPGFNDDIPF